MLSTKTIEVVSKRNPLVEANVEFAQCVVKNMVQPVFVTLTTNEAKISCLGSPINRKNSVYGRKLREWDRQINHHFLGKRFYAKKNKRQSGFFVSEKADRNYHLHGFIDIQEWNFDEYQLISSYIWEAICESGDAVHQLWCPGHSVRYNFKSVTEKSIYEEWVEITYIPYL